AGASMRISALLAFAFVSATLGGMIFVVSAVAPTVFRILPQTEAGRFLRALFQDYYVVFAASSVLAMMAAVAGRVWEALLLAVVAAGFVAARQGLMPRHHHLRVLLLSQEGA